MADGEDTDPMDDGRTMSRHAASELVDGLERTAAVESDPPGLDDLGLNDHVVVAHIDAVTAIVALTQAGYTHTATDGGTATLAATTALAHVTPISSGTIRAHIAPAAGASLAAFQSAARNGVTALRNRDSRLVELLGGEVVPSTETTPAVGDTTTDSEHASSLPLVVLSAAVIAAMSASGVYAIAPNELPEWLGRALLPSPMFFEPRDNLRLQLVALGVASVATMALALSRHRAAAAMAVLTGIGTLVAIAGGVVYFGTNTDWSLVPDVLAPDEVYGVYVIGAAAIVLVAAGLHRLSLSQRVTLACIGLGVLVVLAVWSNSASSQFSLRSPSGDSSAQVTASVTRHPPIGART